jgi:hypothetical protein
MTSPAKQIVDRLIKDLQSRPEDFYCGERTLTHRKSNFQFWLSHGFFSTGVYYPYNIDFGFIQGWRFYRALLQWKANRCVMALAKVEEEKD